MPAVSPRPFGCRGPRRTAAQNCRVHTELTAVCCCVCVRQANGGGDTTPRAYLVADGARESVDPYAPQTWMMVRFKPLLSASCKRPLLCVVPRPWQQSQTLMLLSLRLSSFAKTSSVLSSRECLRGSGLRDVHRAHEGGAEPVGDARRIAMGVRRRWEVGRQRAGRKARAAPRGLAFLSSARALSCQKRRRLRVFCFVKRLRLRPCCC